MATVKDRILLCLNARSTFTPEPRAACGRFHALEGSLICFNKKRQQVALDSNVSFVLVHELESLHSSSGHSAKLLTSRSGGRASLGANYIAHVFTH